MFLWRGKNTDGRLFKLQFEKEIPARKFCIVLNERIPMSAAAAKLLGGLLEEPRTDASDGTGNGAL